MTATTAPDAPDLDDDAGVAEEVEELLELVAQYQHLNRAQRRRIAIAASPEIRTVLAGVERDMALKRSPGSMSAILTDGKEKQAKHLDLIDRVFRDIARGIPRKVLITMPPRHGKSRRAARWAPLWYLARHPDHRVMIASYSADLADDHGRWIRDAINGYGDQIGLYLHAGSKAANRFDLADEEGNRLDGGLVTAGVGGGLTGKGAHLAVVDDPIKDDADAQSPTMRKRLWDWWTSVLLTRIEPGGSVIVIQTRWHEDDLAGRILAGEDASDWTILDLPAIADSEDDPLGREIGRPLWPIRYGLKALAKIRRSVGERVWWSLFQQKPRPMSGGVWKQEWIDDYRISTAVLRSIDLDRIVVAVDPAGGDSSVNDEVGITAAGSARVETVGAHHAYPEERDEYYVLDDKSASLGADEWGIVACRLAIEWQADAIVVESNYGGDMTAQVITQAWQDLARKGLTGRMVMPRLIPVNAKKGKRLRAEPIAQLYGQGRVHHVGQFTKLEGQMVTWMPGMDSPDRMDSAVHALTELAEIDGIETTMDTYERGDPPGRR
ncbi:MULTISPECIES: terminase large subunit domain-containing protein [unclassified Streptomyces]|uniref:terminase large subunit domain-containing protein n=1 Tax=unclassified Streptomyces TaxID=2593676 RepID=UPI002E115031|nr:terminase family protein [Streptomyces sp. NBC_01240]